MARIKTTLISPVLLNSRELDEFTEAIGGDPRAVAFVIWLWIWATDNSEGDGFVQLRPAILRRIARGMLAPVRFLEALLESGLAQATNKDETYFLTHWDTVHAERFRAAMRSKAWRLRQKQEAHALASAPQRTFLRPTRRRSKVAVLETTERTIKHHISESEGSMRAFNGLFR
jgi:hypothetical protein